MRFTCPHCGKPADSADSGFKDSELEMVDIAGQDFPFPPIPLGAERSVDERLCCQPCFERADDRRRDEQGRKIGPHRYTNEYHRTVRQVRDAVGTVRP